MCVNESFPDRPAFADMKRQHKGAALDAAIAEWIAEKDQRGEK
jgi:hypothetical protein